MTERTEIPNKNVLPLLPLKGTVIMPHQVAPLGVGRPKSLRALETALAGDRMILLAAQKQDDQENPTPADIYPVGTICKILQVGKQPDGVLQVIVEGVVRAELLGVEQMEPYFEMRVAPRPDPVEKSLEIEALMRGVVSQFERFARFSRSVAPEQYAAATQADEPGKLADLVAQHLPLKLEERQQLLELAPKDRLELLSQVLTREVNILELERKIQNRVRKQMEKSQREYFLKEQMKAIQQELGESDERQSEVAEYKKKIETANLPEHVKEKALEELSRLEKMPPMVAEAVVVRTYLDWLLSVPWTVRTEDRLDITEARRILDEDHYGLDKAKDRVVEYLAVRKLAQTSKGPILCFIGPPGTGKTSLGRSIARALGRKFVRVSLGGVRDEAEIRGHRRTYVGALPGRIVQGLRRGATRNPVFVLDEVDKVGADFRGDPSSALLEVLDPEQNVAFRDHYLDVPFDLSEVLFITTANILDPIPPALRDRMEVLEIPGYTEEEKLNIGRDHLVQKQIANHGLTPEQLTIGNDALSLVIRGYTREAGVRNLEREIGALCRKAARRRAEGNETPLHITPDVVVELLGAPHFLDEEMEERTKEPGVAIGLAWTPAGGDVLFIEASRMAGSGALTLTGSLGEVMKESARAALSWFRAHSATYGADPEFFKNSEIHLHVPSGAIPKDGPSAGVTMTTAMASELTRRPVRGDIAMTGEITLSGRVLPIGGVKEKVLAARRVGIREVILPKQNAKNINEDLTPELRQDLTVHFVSTIDEVLALALQPVASDVRPAVTKPPRAI